MVVALRPGKFYGSSLPRPWLVVKGEEEEEKDGVVRLEPPPVLLGVLDPLMSWANEAHLSMGGLRFKRLRLQGRTEGNIKKLCSAFDHQNNHLTLHNNNNKGEMRRTNQPSSPPTAPKPKRRRLALEDDDDRESMGTEDDEIIRKWKRKLQMKGRKLEDDAQSSLYETTSNG